MAHNTQSRNDRFDGYIPVAERVEKFYERFTEGRILTQVIEHDRESGFVLVRAEVYRSPDDAQPAATGHAYEVRGESFVNKSSYIENAETSAVGRSLALLGFEVKRGIASREEFEKAARMQPSDKGAVRQAQPPVEEDGTTLDADILQSAGELGYDAAKVRKWVNQKYEVTGGLESLTAQDKREVLKVFREKVLAAQAKGAAAK
ncbi:MAG: hypothetical protein ACR2LZ_09640 [Pyrinomonadaceae bacterium]